MTKQRVETNGPRAELAKAIEAARDAEAHCAALRTSIARIEDERFAARQSLDAATAREANEPKGNDAVIDRLLAGEGSTAVLERPADRKEAAEAERTIDTCNRALAILRPELVGAERAHELRIGRVRDAAGAVIAAERLDELVAAAARLRAELESHEAVLSFLHSYIPRDQATKIEKALVSPKTRGEHSALAPWRASLDALSRSATAELPK